MNNKLFSSESNLKILQLLIRILFHKLLILHFLINMNNSSKTKELKKAKIENIMNKNDHNHEIWKLFDRKMYLCKTCNRLNRATRMIQTYDGRDLCLNCQTKELKLNCNSRNCKMNTTFEKSFHVFAIPECSICHLKFHEYCLWKKKNQKCVFKSFYFLSNVALCESCKKQVLCVYTTIICGYLLDGFCSLRVLDRNVLQYLIDKIN